MCHPGHFVTLVLSQWTLELCHGATVHIVHRRRIPVQVRCLEAPPHDPAPCKEVKALGPSCGEARVKEFEVDRPRVSGEKTYEIDGGLAVVCNDVTGCVLESFFQKGRAVVCSYRFLCLLAEKFMPVAHIIRFWLRRMTFISIIVEHVLSIGQVERRPPCPPLPSRLQPPLPPPSLPPPPYPHPDLQRLAPSGLMKRSLVLFVVVASEKQWHWRVLFQIISN